MKEYNKTKQLLLELLDSDFIPSLKDTFREIIDEKTKALCLDFELKPIQTLKPKNRYIKSIIQKVRGGSSKKVITFTDPKNLTTLSVPLILEDTFFGVLLLIGLKHRPDKKDINFINVFASKTLKGLLTQQELNNLHDTIKPRAIALSTIHTIHRLLTSTLDMDELIERIARLTLQVMRAKYCSIMLLDDAKKYLIPKALINLERDEGKLRKKHRKIKIGNTVAGKAAKTGKTNLEEKVICVPLVEEDIMGVLCAKNKIDNTPFTKFDMEILLTLAEQAVIAMKNAQLYEEQKKMAYGSIKSLAALLDAKSPHTFTHSELFLKIILAIATEMKLSREEIRNLRYAALLPDTGKFSIPDEILEKRGHLSKQEFNIVKKQHLESLNILTPLEFLKPVLPIIMYHHERYDGAGYPEGLKGDEIPIGARIMTVADAFEAMISSRPHKDGHISTEQALQEIKKNKGTQFDPDVVNAFMKAVNKPEFKKLVASLK
ncbi:MAG: HD domain-containing phosphohydrolase [Candidatus Omnitrophota bacterium]|jgi:HD-GYP domain-containing protein (c-di-GMP phosphodiesterase class II)|nr:HD domain-containing phosphohydrolase [Candidatus Omnitrophota bacterium]